jgi:hypothetical protein
VFNREEARVTADLTTRQKKALASSLRAILRTLEGDHDGE